MKYEIDELEKDIVKLLGTYILNIAQVAKLLNKSSSTLGRWRKAGIGLKYRKSGASHNSTVEYTARSVAEYITSNNIKII